jgi:hypothetical protein
LEAVGVSAASQTAMRETLEAVISTRLQAAVSELLHIAESMDVAASQGDEAGARSLTSRWAWRMTEVGGLLRSRYGRAHEFREPLEASEETILRAKNELYEPGRDARLAAREASVAMHSVCRELGPVVNELSPLQSAEQVNE